MAKAAVVLVIGQLTPDGRWAGICLGADGWQPVFGRAERTRPVANYSPARRRTLLVAAAAAYFSEALPQTGMGLEATQADLAEVMRWLADSEADRSTATLLRQAIEAVDDGLPGDAVANRLIPLIVDEQVDPVDLLVEEALRPSRE